MTRKTKSYTTKKGLPANPRMADEAPMRLRRLRISGMRTLADVTLDLNGLTVLIGDNGAGKSSILEACEILRKAAKSSEFLTQVNQIHGGVREIRSFGLPELTIQAEFVWRQKTAVYLLALGDAGVAREILKVGGAVHLDRSGKHDFVFRESLGKNEDWAGFPSDKTILASQGEVPGEETFREVIASLGGIEVHLPFDVVPRWIAREGRRPSPMRESSVVEPAKRLDRRGENLANAFAWLKDRPGGHWETTMDWVRLGLGHDIETVLTEAQPGGGAIALSLRYKAEKVIPAYALSDGMLAYLAFVAVFRLNGNNSLLAFDEPELHLHPELLARVVDFMEAAAECRPVLVATQSDALVDHLQEPAAAVVLCELDDKGTTQIVRPNPAALARWLDRYRGLGDIRAAGHQRSVMQVRPLPKLRVGSAARHRKG
jgi:predicted ATPase